MFERLIERLIFLKKHVLTEANIRHMAEQGTTLVEMLQEIVLTGIQRGEEMSELIIDAVEMVAAAQAKVAEGQATGLRGIDLDQKLNGSDTRDLFEALARVELP